MERKQAIQVHVDKQPKQENDGQETDYVGLAMVVYGPSEKLFERSWDRHC